MKFQSALRETHFFKNGRNSTFPSAIDFYDMDFLPLSSACWLFSFDLLERNLIYDLLGALFCTKIQNYWKLSG